MKFIRNYKSYKNYKSLLEAFKDGYDAGVKHTDVPGIVGTQLKNFIQGLNEQITVEQLIESVNSELLNNASPKFILKPLVDELTSPGTAAWNNPSEPAFIDKSYYFTDFVYIMICQSIFSKMGYFFGTDKSITDSTLPSGMKLLKEYCDEKFGENKVPYTVIRYFLSKIRSEISKVYKFDEEQEDEFIKPPEDAKQPIGTKVPLYFYTDESPGKTLPELKKILISCGGRDLGEPNIPFSNYKSQKILPKLKPIGDKKRTAFINWLKKVTQSITETSKRVTVEDLNDILEKNGLSTGTKFVEGDKVLYLKKDKTIDDWDKLSDKDKENLESEITKEVVAEGKIKSVKEDVIEIEFGGEGKTTTKKKSEIIKKLE
jgi:hypothetical protein